VAGWPYKKMEVVRFLWFWLKNTGFSIGIMRWDDNRHIMIIVMDLPKTVSSNVAGWEIPELNGGL